jgi:hypothetical protein
MSAASVGLFNTVVNSSYAAYTKYAFALTETVAIAELRCQGLEYETIKQRVVVDDLLQIRSQTSRQGAFRTIWQRLEKLPSEYIYLIAKGHADIRRFTVLFAILLEHRLLQELIANVLLNKVKQFDLMIAPTDVRVFFETQRENSQTLASWSEATYQKASSGSFALNIAITRGIRKRDLGASLRTP